MLTPGLSGSPFNFWSYSRRELKIDEDELKIDESKFIVYEVDGKIYCSWCAGPCDDPDDNEFLGIHLLTQDDFKDTDIVICDNCGERFK